MDKSTKKDIGQSQRKIDIAKAKGLVVFIGADYKKWLWDYKITGFTIFVRDRWGMK